MKKIDFESAMNNRTRNKKAAFMCGKVRKLIKYHKLSFLP